jgi:hypothetical protein
MSQKSRRRNVAAEMSPQKCRRRNVAAEMSPQKCRALARLDISGYFTI